MIRQAPPVCKGVWCFFKPGSLQRQQGQAGVQFQKLFCAGAKQCKSSVPSLTLKPVVGDSAWQEMEILDGGRRGSTPQTLFAAAR